MLDIQNKRLGTSNSTHQDQMEPMGLVLDNESNIPVSKDFGVGERLASEVRGLLPVRPCEGAGGVRPWPRGCLTLAMCGGWTGNTGLRPPEAGTGWCDDLSLCDDPSDDLGCGGMTSLSRVSGAGAGGSCAPASLSGTLDRDSEFSPSLRSSF